MAEEWVGIINTTAPRFLKGAIDSTIRERLILSLLRKRGRITTGHSGRDLTWDVEFKQPIVNAYGDGGVIDFSRHDLYRQLTLDVRGYVVTDMMTAKEKAMNAGDYAIIKRYDRIMPNLMKAIKDKFGSEVYLDGYAAGNENRLCGFNSFTGTGTTASTDRIAKPDDTYGGKDTDVGAQGGTWSATLSTKPNANIATDWPDGSGSAEYDYLSPKLINWSASTAWGTGSATWIDNCERVIRQAKIWSVVTSGMGGAIELLILSPDLFYGYANKQSTFKQIMVPHKEAEDLGFGDALNQEGLAIHYEFGITPSEGYGFNFSQMELMSWNSELFTSVGPEYAIQQDAWLFKVGFFGNMKFNPKAFVKLNDYA